MGGSSEVSKGLLERQPGLVQFRLRRLIHSVTFSVDLVTTGAEHRGREHLADSLKEIGSESDDFRQGETELASGRL